MQCYQKMLDIVIAVDAAAAVVILPTTYKRYRDGVTPLKHLLHNLNVLTAISKGKWAVNCFNRILLMNRAYCFLWAMEF